MNSKMEIETASGLARDLKFNGIQSSYNAFMGVSIRNKFFTKPVMRSYIKWISDNFKEGVILLMDAPDRYNQVVFKGLDEQSALQSSNQIADDHQIACNRIILQYGISNIKILRYRDFSQDPTYVEMYDLVYKLVNTNKEFESRFKMCVEENIGYKIDSHIASHKQERSSLVNILVHHIIEEFIAMMYFLKEGYLVEIDPHKELSIKTDIYEADLVNMKKLLSLPSERGHINLQTHLNSYYKT